MSISAAESEVMQILWASPCLLSAEQVHAALAGLQPWQESTVKTLLNRLLKKRAVAAERDGRRFLYRPLLARGDYLHAQSTSLVDRLFGGRIAPLVAGFGERRKLSKTDIAELRALIESFEHDR